MQLHLVNDLKKHQQKCSQAVSGFTLRWIINRIRNGVKGLRHYNFHYIFFRDRLHQYKTILAVTYLSRLIRLSHVFINHLLNVTKLRVRWQRKSFRKSEENMSGRPKPKTK
jgi:hypothetical protein